MIRYDALSDHYRRSITKSAGAVAANGSPLDVVGCVKLPVSIGSFCTTEDFIVTRQLTVDCLLGAKFLRRHKAVIDCKTGTLSIGDVEALHKVPLSIDQHVQDTYDPVCVICPMDFEIPGRSVQLFHGRLQGNVVETCEVLIEQEGNSIPSGLCVARSLSPVLQNQGVVLQVMNTSPTPIKLYKGSKLGIATPRHSILLLDIDDQPNTKVPSSNKDPNTAFLKEIDMESSSLMPSERAQLQKLLQNFSDVFKMPGKPNGRTPLVKHTIPTKGSPIRQPLRRLPEKLKRIVDEEINEMLKNDIIRPSNSPWSSPVVMVRKPDGSWRFCIDFRRLNSVTHKDAFPLPRIDATLDTLANVKYFSSLDLASGYWQVEVQEDDKQKTAFSTCKGHFEFQVMPFGLTNAPATFQRLMQCVLAGLTETQCLIYLDDILVFSKSFSEHLLRLENVLIALRKAGLKLKPSKCHFAQKEVKFLGHIISHAGVSPDPAKIEAVSTYPVPQNVQQLRRFMGLSNYYRRFIANYSKIAGPLNKLLSKSSSFIWSKECQLAFDNLKHHLTIPPILAFPDFSIQFTLYTDASDTAVGGVLSQTQHGQERVIAYWSRQLHKAEKNYSTTEKEALAVVAGIKEFYPYLYGSRFTLVTDHNPLLSLKGLKDIGGRLSRWIIFLQQFDMEFVYKAGKTHQNADAMSRIPIVNQVSTSVHQFLPDSDQLRASQWADEVLGPLWSVLKHGKSLPMTTPVGLRKSFLMDGLLCRPFQSSSTECPITQLIIPRSMYSSVLHQLHDNAGHLGIHKTLAKVKERFYWPGYEQDVERHIKECQQCQQRNPPNPTPRGPLGTIVATRPFQILSWDIMGPLPLTSKGKRYILVVTDLFSKWVEAFPLASTDADTLAKTLVNEVISRYGVPSSLHSDQGANLTGQVVSSLCKCLGITRTQTTAYHPQGNGQVERFNRTLEAMLAKVVKENQTNWDLQIPLVLLAYRTAIHEATGFTPYRVNFGRSPTLPVDIMLGRAPTSCKGEETRIPVYVQELNSHLKSIFNHVRIKLKSSHAQNKDRHDQAVAGDQLAVGDRVWLYIPAVKQGQTKKLSSLWRGPYTIIDRVGSVTYRIQLIGTAKTLVVHRNRLKLCYGIPDRSQQPNAPPQVMCSPSVDINDHGVSHRPVVQEDRARVRYGPSLPSDDEEGDRQLPTQSTVLQTATNDPTQGTVTDRPQRNRRPPILYGDFVSSY